MRALKMAALGFLGLGVFTSSSSAAPYLPPGGYQRAAESFSGDVFAVAPDGKVAIATGSASGNAQIRVYADAAAAQANSSPVRTFTAPNYKAWGDLTFANNDTLIFAENSDPTNATDAVYRGIVSTGATTPLGNVPNVAGVAQFGANIYAVAANNPGTGVIYSLVGGNATPVISNIGVGYLGGIAVDAAGNLLLTDTNDPTFVGNAGKILRYTSGFTPLSSIDLAGGGGSGAYDLVLDSDGDAFVTTGGTITRVPNESLIAEKFGSTFGGDFPFLTGLDFAGAGYEPFAGTGTLWVNATFTEEGKIIGITVPEPAGIVLLATIASALPLSRKRRKLAAPLAMSLAVLATVAFTMTARADQFFATEVVARTVGTQQQPQFTDPSYALGAPRGAGTTDNSFHVYCLGNGGSLTLGFDTPGVPRAIADTPGRDFIVSENAFFENEEPTRSFAELMWVEVSTNGVDFARFPAHSRTATPIGPFGTLNRADLKGFAGVNPVFANADENDIDPFDLQSAGGDSFDLSWLVGEPAVVAGAVELDEIRFVRFVDVIGNGSTRDFSGQPLYDPTGVGIGGADVDAIAVLHGVLLTLGGDSGSTPEPSTAAALSGAAAIALARRRA